MNMDNSHVCQVHVWSVNASSIIFVPSPCTSLGSKPSPPRDMNTLYIRLDTNRSNNY